MYNPPSTNAQLINIVTGATQPITSPTALILFSSDDDVAKILPLVKALDPSAELFDGAGIVCPPVAYGSDGRRVNCVQGTINGQQYQAAIGILVAQQFWGPMWNQMRQTPYTKLYADPIPGGVQLNWGN
jgi:hypothetical protein